MLAQENVINATATNTATEWPNIVTNLKMGCENLKKFLV